MWLFADILLNFVCTYTNCTKQCKFLINIYALYVCYAWRASWLVRSHTPAFKKIFQLSRRSTHNLDSISKGIQDTCSWRSEVLLKNSFVNFSWSYHTCKVVISAGKIDKVFNPVFLASGWRRSRPYHLN